MRRYLYSLVLYLATPVLLAYLLWRSRREPAYRRGVAERFGLQRPVAPRDAVWVHAASVGEVQAVSSLIRACQARWPDRPVVISTLTPAGHAHVTRLFGDTVQPVLLPFDQPHAMRRFLATLRPRVAVIMEMELWPNLFAAVRRRGIPLLLINARLSARSARRYRRLGRLVRDMLATPATIAAQTQADADRLIALGAPAARVQLTGNLKFDVAVPAPRGEVEGLPRAGAGRRPVWIAASTRDGEEPLVLKAFDRVRAEHADALLVLVPRHPDRFETVAALCRAQGLTLARRSRGEDPAAANVLLGDTMGELSVLYSAADVAFVGGSLVPLGGQNVLEPAAMGLPVIVGPHTFNFSRVVDQLLECGGALRVTDAAALGTTVSRLLGDADERRDRGHRGQALIAANRGAGERVLTLLAAFLTSPRLRDDGAVTPV
mgnify:CR=1 FL=1